MDTKRKILLALGLRFEDKDHVFPPKSAFTDENHGEMHPTPPFGQGHGQGGQTPPSTPHSF